MSTYRDRRAVGPAMRKAVKPPLCLSVLPLEKFSALVCERKRGHPGDHNTGWLQFDSGDPHWRVTWHAEQYCPAED